MSDGTLPHRVNLRKAVTREARYSGVLDAQQLPQFAATLATDQPLRVEVLFKQDDEGHQIAEVTLDASVVLECQRCMEPFPDSLHSSSRLGLVFDDEQARHLPASLEPWIAVEEVDLWEMAAEELALALPVVSYHGQGECRAPASESGVVEEEGALSRDESPFSVLSALLEGSAEEEKK